MKKISTILFWVCVVLPTPSFLFAQGMLQKEADRAVQNLDYVTAISLYRQVVERDADNVEAKLSLADCYRQVNDTENAEKWYAETVRSKIAKPVHRLYYGMVLQANGKCDKAKAWFAQYVSDKPEDVRGQHLARSCDARDYLMKTGEGIYKVRPLPVNSDKNDFAPAIQKDQLVFSSERAQDIAAKRTNMYSGNAFAELYSVRFDGAKKHPSEFQFDPVKKFGSGLNTKYHEAAITFSPDQQTIFLTRSNYLNGKTGKSETGLIKLKIYTGSADASETWNTLQEMPFCSDEYNTAHPTLSNDGKLLYFSSNKPGGYGGMDLYVSQWESGHWGMPINLGPAINTEGNEIFPFAANDGRLYFSSNSHVGLGGLDIYYSTPKGRGDWNIPVNLGAPVNSHNDDFGITFSSDNTWGIFTSNRDGGKGGDDLYGFTKSAIPVEIYVYDPLTKQPLRDAIVFNKKSGLNMITGLEGRVAFDMRMDECIDFQAERKNYEPAQKTGCSSDVRNSGLLRIEIPLEKKADFSIQGIVFDEEEGLPVENVEVTLTNDCGKPIGMALTGPDGRYRFRLEKNCCYTVRAKIDNFASETIESQCTDDLPQGEVLRADLNLQPVNKAKGTGNAPKTTSTPSRSVVRPIFNEKLQRYENADGTPANFILDNGVVIKDGLPSDNGAPRLPESSGWTRGKGGIGYNIKVFYDSDQAAIQQESRTELEKLLQTLLENPTFMIEIAAHTDSRGPDDYNQNLSQRRAEAVVDWLVKNGVRRERLKAQGYGESLPVNNCINGVECREEQHQQNRRTEFIILNNGR
jgi:outer membrane protein OmpA-like peptidoglycan-associated protein/tetratricopeptide (TPR) repeat protein